jgi:plasmid rolling circle replication initiator protein Rep
MMPKILELYPNHKWLLLTLTVQNMPVNQLKDAVRHMQAAWQRLRQRKAFPAIGYIKSLEVTRQESNGFAHPHFHVLMLVPSGYFSHGYIKQYDWRKMWMEALRADYLPSVNIKAVKSKNPKDPHDITSAIIEVLKYETKMLDLEKHPDFLLELAMQLHKSRAVEVGGVLKELIKEEISDDDLLLQSDEDKLEDLKKMMTFTWQRGIRRYQKLD